MTTMYRLPPIIPPNMVFDLPTTMYQLPVIQNSNIEHQNQQVPSTVSFYCIIFGNDYLNHMLKES